MTEGDRLLRALRFPPVGRKPRPSRTARMLAFLLAGSSAAGISGVMVSQVIGITTVEGPGGLLGSVLYLSVVVAALSIIAGLVVRLRGFSVQDGVMTLVMPRKTVSGKRLRHIPLVDMVSVERITQPGADPGILVTLRDGTVFPVFDADLYQGGRAFLDRLAAAVAEQRPYGGKGPPEG